MASELVVLPLAIVGDPAGLVEEFAVSGHLVLPPLAVVEPPVLVVELALAVPHAVDLLPLVLGALLELLGDVLHVRDRLGSRRRVVSLGTDCPVGGDVDRLGVLGSRQLVAGRGRIRCPVGLVRLAGQAPRGNVAGC